VIATIGTRATNGPLFPVSAAFCAIPRKGINILGLSLMNKLNLAHYPKKGAFPYATFVVNPKTHDMFIAENSQNP
jgi:hypothetical protein